jgi:hypothetical protein
MPSELQAPGPLCRLQDSSCPGVMPDLRIAARSTAASGTFRNYEHGAVCAQRGA